MRGRSTGGPHFLADQTRAAAYSHPMTRPSPGIRLLVASLLAAAALVIGTAVISQQPARAAARPVVMSAIALPIEAGAQARVGAACGAGGC